MSYIPHTPREVEQMLGVLNLNSLEELFAAIPPELQLKRQLNLPSPLSERALFKLLEKISRKNCDQENHPSFLGGGSYHHFIPAAVAQLVSRSEFYTSYTPYQPEISQGTLQTIYEFQTLISQLTGREIANASLYDGASALAEASLMAKRITRRSSLIVSRSVHPYYRDVLSTYTQNSGIELEEAPYNNISGLTDLSWIKENISAKTAAVIIQNPNFFGIIESLKEVKQIVSQEGALFIVSVPEPISLGILRPPGEFGADVVVGEGQSLGIPSAWGGPSLGFLAARKSYLRNIPGRLAGETVDQAGKRGYVLTLCTREQHIRRGRATSNICSNQGLCALAATISLSLLGKKGLREMGRHNLIKADYAQKKIARLPGLSRKFNSAIFNEFVMKTDYSLAAVKQRLTEKGIRGGIGLEKFYPELKNCLLFCVTECNTRQEIDLLCAVLGELK